MSIEQPMGAEQASLKPAQTGGDREKMSQAGRAAFAIMQATNKNAAHTAEQIDRLVEHLLSGESTPRARQAKPLLALLHQIAGDQVAIANLLRELLRRVPPMVVEEVDAA